MKIIPSPLRTRPGLRRRAFTLIEVMIAMALFFIAMFSILELVGQSLRSVRLLNQHSPNAGILAAELAVSLITNRLEEGSETGDFGKDFAGYSWTRDISFYASNGMFRVDYVVMRDGKLDSTLSTLVYDPKSAQGIRRAGGRR